MRDEEFCIRPWLVERAVCAPDFSEPAIKTRKEPCRGVVTLWIKAGDGVVVEVSLDDHLADSGRRELHPPLSADGEAGLEAENVQTVDYFQPELEWCGMFGHSY